MKCVLKRFVCPSHPHLPHLPSPLCLCTALGARMPQVLHIIKLKPGIKLWPLAALMCRTANSSAGQWCIDCACCLLPAALWCLVPGPRGALLLPPGVEWLIATSIDNLSHFPPGCPPPPHFMPTRAFGPFSPLRTCRIYHFYKPLALSGCHIAVTTGYRPHLLVKLSTIKRSHRTIQDTSG